MRVRRILSVVLSIALLCAAENASIAKGGKPGGKKPKADQPAPGDTTQSPTPPASQPSEDNSALHKAQADLQAAQAAARAKYESDPAWTAAAADLKSAQIENEAATAPVMAAVKSDASYKAAAAELAKAEAKIAEIRASDVPDPSGMSQAAGSAMSARATMRSVESSALNSDSAASAAQQKLKAAVEAMTKLRSGEAKAVAADATVVSAKEAVDAAKGSAKTTSG